MKYLSWDGLKYFYNKYIRPLGTASKQDVANNLTTVSSGYVLDARQGKILGDRVEKVEPLVSRVDKIEDVVSELGNIIYSRDSDISVRPNTNTQLASVSIKKGGYYIVTFQGEITALSGGKYALFHLGTASFGKWVASASATDGTYRCCGINFLDLTSSTSGTETVTLYAEHNDTTSRQMGGQIRIMRIK